MGHEYNKHVLDQIEKRVQSKIEKLKKNGNIKLAGTDFERIVYDALIDLGIKESQIQHSSRKFPDFIISNDQDDSKLGLEVKKINEDTWKILGGSIYESIRNRIEDTYVLMGKFGGKPEARLKRYEECINNLVVTHSPRVELNLELEAGQDYLTKNNAKDILELEEGEALNQRIRELLRTNKDTWYCEKAITSLSSLSKTERRKYFIDGIVLFPEAIGGKYERFAIWMTYKCLVWSKNVRDTFSAGGTVFYDGVYISRVMKNILDSENEIVIRIKQMSPEEMNQYWGEKIDDPKERIDIWLNSIRENIKLSPKLIQKNVDQEKEDGCENAKEKVIETFMKNLENDLRIIYDRMEKNKENDIT